MKPIDVQSNSYAEYNVDSMLKILNFKLEFQNTKKKIPKGYAPNWSEEGLVISKIKNTVPRTYLIMDLNGEGITGTFFEK